MNGAALILGLMLRVSVVRAAGTGGRLQALSGSDGSLSLWSSLPLLQGALQTRQGVRLSFMSFWG